MIFSYLELFLCCETAEAAADSHELSRVVICHRGGSKRIQPVAASTAAYSSRHLVERVLKTLILKRHMREGDDRIARICALGRRYTRVMFMCCRK